VAPCGGRLLAHRRIEKASDAPFGRGIAAKGVLVLTIFMVFRRRGKGVAHVHRHRLRAGCFT
jgi:hypothetical protein